MGTDALVEVPKEKAVTGKRYLTFMKHGWISGQWDGESLTCCDYYWRDMEWYPYKLFELPEISE